MADMQSNKPLKPFADPTALRGFPEPGHPMDQGYLPRNVR